MIYDNNMDYIFTHDDSDQKNMKELQDLLDFSDAKKTIIVNNLVSSVKLHDGIDISKDVYKDTNIDKWSRVLPKLYGSKQLIQRLIHNPINNETLLKERQASYDKISSIDINKLEELQNLRHYEDDVLWIYKLNEEILANNLIYSLFPTGFIISYMNYISPLLELYHIYKIYITPLTILLYPIMTLFAPLYYLNKFLNFNLTISSYLAMLYNIFKMFVSFSGGIKAVLIKIISLSFYIFIFIYNTYQTLEYCYLLHNARDTLYKKICSLNIFLKSASSIISSLPSDIIDPFIIQSNDISLSSLVSLNNNMTNIYKIWKDDNIKDNISKILHKIYTIDIIYSIHELYKNKNWCLAEYNQNNIKIWNMKNPLLSNKQTANPIDLSKNFVITGPNAAGKTTYVKSILSNIILSQSFGICYAQKANVVLYDCISSFMRISDILGSKSYFEVEAEYCSKMMKKATELSHMNKKALFLMDEPMHSTPPIEGMSTAFAVAEYIGNLSGTSIILTTHFHKLIHLADIYPDKFINLSVEAIPQEKGFLFPYKIRRGHSYQCIAIELLSSKDFNKSVIESAINMKNKIYNELNSR